MSKYDQFFKFSEYHIEHFFAYLVFAAVLAFYLVVKSDSKYKIELFFISFYLLTGNYNNLLLIEIPGFNFFKIPPIRFIYLMLLFFIIRKKWYSNRKIKITLNKSMPWFEVALFAYVILLSISVFINIFPQGIKVILDAVAFIIIAKALGLMADKASYDLIGRTIIIAAVISSIVSLLQLTIDPYLLRLGDNRSAFGGVLRSNGIFGADITTHII